MSRLLRHPLVIAWAIVGLVWLGIFTAPWWAAPLGGLFLLFGFGSAILAGATALFGALVITVWSLCTEPPARRWWNVGFSVVGLGWQVRLAGALLGF